MKDTFVLGFTLVLARSAFALTQKRADVHFGPQNCVTLSQSAAGSCVISTDCGGADISQTEFAFDCVEQNKVVRHSFGIGGFEGSEEFDTEVKCDRCASTSSAEAAKAAPVAPPVKKVVPVTKPVQAIQRKAPKAEPKAKAHKEEVVGAMSFRAKAASSNGVTLNGQVKAKSKMWPFKSSSKSSSAVQYGPDGCVSVSKSSEGHCVMQTDCKDKDISNYEFGLVCVDKAGSPVKHLFGKDSFDKAETFDTLIKCDQCLGLEDLPDSVTLAGEVATMSKDIGNLKAVMRNISINVQMLNEKVFPTPPAAPAAAAGPAPAPAPAPAPVAAAEEEPKKVKFAVRQRRHHGHLRRSHKRHHHRREYDDEDEDEDEDDGDRDDSDDQPAAVAPTSPPAHIPYSPSVVAKGTAQLAKLANGDVSKSSSKADDDDDDDDEDGSEYDRD